TFSITYSLASGYVLAGAPAIVTIEDDDDPPTVTLSVDQADILETGGVATFTATLDTVSGLATTVGLAFGGTATGATHYTASGNNISIAAGDTTGVVTITAVNNTIPFVDA